MGKETHFSIGKQPLTGLRNGLVTVLTALYLNFYAARSRQARLCCCLMLYFGIGIIVTGVSGI